MDKAGLWAAQGVEFTQGQRYGYISVLGLDLVYTVFGEYPGVLPFLCAARVTLNADHRRFVGQVNNGQVFAANIDRV